MQSALRRPLLTAVHHRSLWTKATASGRDIKECIATVCEPWKDKRANACIALVSKSFSDYGNVVHELNERLQPSTLVGAVVDRVAGLQHGITLYVGDEDEKVVGFHTADTRERHKVRSISVGRWGRIEDFDRLRFQGNKLNEYGWDAFGTISRPAQQYALPPPLAGCTDTPSFIFMASDNEPDQLLQALDHHYPNATKLGIIGASTPFVTGEPYMLFDKEHAQMGAGIVGLAAFSKSGKNADVTVEHTSLEPLGQPMTITRCRGNIILDLDQAGATGLLLALLQQGQDARIHKDQEFYLGIYPPGHQDCDPAKMAVNRITSGDPSRGNMSVDTTADLQVGQVVQFMKRVTASGELATDKDSATLAIVDRDQTIDASPIQLPEKGRLLEGIFGAASENGIILGRPGLPSQILDVPFSKAKFNL